MNFASERPQNDDSRLWVRTASVEIQARIKSAWKITEGELTESDPSVHDQLCMGRCAGHTRVRWPGIGAGQRAEAPSSAP